MPKSFQISQLPSEINSWLIYLLQQLPVSKQLQELHTTTRLEPGNGGGDIASPSDATTPSPTGSVKSSKMSYSEHLPWLSEKAGSRKIALNHWLKEQLEVPSHMWYRPFGNWADRIPLRTQTTFLASFYQCSSEPIATTIPSRCNKNKRPYPSLCLTN